MRSMPYTVAQRLVDYLAPDVIVNLDTESYLSLALTCRSLKTAAYKHIRQPLMYAQAAWVKNLVPTVHGMPEREDWPVGEVHKNPLVDIDPLIIHFASIWDEVMFEGWKNHIDSGLADTMIMVGWKDHTLSSSQGRWMRSGRFQGDIWLMKDCTYTRQNRRPHNVSLHYAMVAYRPTYFEARLMNEMVYGRFDDWIKVDWLAKRGPFVGP
ncbi:hypothetical protein BDZ88DRAFT_436213 [Geranomyces variabilis]|nr:hypothetical protein BDZ88DRAFT_436213 [Geranomyces variabilis]KAJ3134217.1 hypothetical protein HDU90_005314 [Geranomyces variabilis]